MALKTTTVMKHRMSQRSRLNGVSDGLARIWYIKLLFCFFIFSLFKKKPS